MHSTTTARNCTAIPKSALHEMSGFPKLEFRVRDMGVSRNEGYFLGFFFRIRVVVNWRLYCGRPILEN